MIPSICIAMHDDDDDDVILLAPALRVSPAETRLTVYRRPHIPGKALWGLCWVPTFEFQTVIRAKTAQNLTIYFEILNQTHA